MNKKGIDRLITTSGQLGMWRFLSYLTLRLTRRLFDRSLIPSYSQFGEDRVIEAYFHAEDTGFYVDVGCNHPVTYSNTWLLYQKGWRGICIDPNPALIREYKKIRPQDVAVQSVVSRNESDVEFYFSKESHLISGVGPKSDGHWQRTRQNSDVVLCPARRLTEILVSNKAPNKIDLISIDVEGHEMEVLESLDFNQFMPQLIVVEMHDLNLKLASEDEIYRKLVGMGYRLISFLQPSAFFELEDNG